MEENIPRICLICFYNFRQVELHPIDISTTSQKVMWRIQESDDYVVDIWAMEGKNFPV